MYVSDLCNIHIVLFLQTPYIYLIIHSHDYCHLVLILCSNCDIGMRTSRGMHVMTYQSKLI